MYQLLLPAVLPADGPRAGPPPGLRAGSAAPPASRCCAPSSRPPSRPATRSCAPRPWACRMHGPFGLAAGFDKNAVAIDGMTMLGFDHVEIGTVTAQPQPGNPKKRLFRLVPDRALINRMGFNNDGSAAVAARLAARNPVFPATVGVNIGKTKIVPEDEAVGDYVTSTERLAAPRRLPGRQRLLPEHPGAAQPPGRRPPAPAADRRPRGRRPHGHRPPGPAAGQDRPGPRRRGHRRRRRPRRRARPGRHHRHQHHHRPRRPRPDLRPGPGRRDRRPVRRTRQGALPGGAAPPVRPRGRPDHPRRGRRHRNRRGRLAAHPGRRHPGPGLQRLHLRGPLLVPRASTRAWPPGCATARTPPSPTPSAPSTRR